MPRPLLVLLFLVANPRIDGLSSISSGGKNGKKKKAKESSTSTKAMPRRITSASTQSSGISLKTQLRLVKAVKSSAPEPLRTKQKKVGTKKEKKEDFSDEIRQVRFFERPLLLIDGYNVIFGTDLKDREISEARRKLTADVSMLLTMMGRWDAAKVVFDGREKQSIPDSPNVEVVFTSSGRSADSEIERMTADRRGLGHGATVVVSNDALIRLVADTMGAEILTVDQFQSQVTGARLALSQALETNRIRNRLELMQDSTPSDDDESRERAALQRGLKALLTDVDRRRRFAPLRTFLLSDESDDWHHAALALDRLRDLEVSNVVQAAHLSDWLHHQKLLFGLTETMAPDWWDHPDFQRTIFRRSTTSISMGEDDSTNSTAVNCGVVDDGPSPPR